MANEVRVLVTANTADATSKLKNVEKVSLGLTAAFAAVGVASIKMAADFEHGLDQVGAVAGATKGEMTQLRTEALKIGADTSKSAGEATKAMEELAAGGRSVAQIMGGEARAAVALSEAGNYDLAESARTVATAMDVWKDTSINTTDVVNRLAGAANTSRFGVEDMSQAIAAGGGVAASAGINFQDFSTAIAATASSFNSGSDAGTSFKTFITSLSGNSEKAKEAIEELGLSFYDAQGAMKPMSAIVQELHDKLGPLSQQQQTVYLKQIFGNDAFRTAAGLMKMTGDEFSAMSSKMGSTDAAAVAKQRMDNLNGSLEELKGSMETVAISIGSKAIPALTQAAEGATKIVNAFGALPDSTQNMVLLGSATAVALPGIISLADRAADQIKRMGSELKTGKLSASTFALGLTAIAVSLDAVLAKTSGHGVIEWVFGDPTKADASEKAMRKFNAVLEAYTKETDKVAAGTRLLTRASEDFDEALNDNADSLTSVRTLLSPIPGVLSETEHAISKTKGTLEGQAKAFIELNPTISEMNSLLAKVPEESRKVIASSEEYANWLATQNELLAKNTEALYLDGLAVTKVAEALPVATTAAQDWAATVEEAEDGTKDFEKALQALFDQFATGNPHVIALNASHAKLTEELEDLKDKGDQATAADRRRIDQIENELLPAIDKETKKYGDNQKAIEGQSGAVQALLGPAGYGALLSKMNELDVAQEDQLYVVGKLTDAYAAIVNKEIPDAVAGFANLKKELSPEVWAVIAEAVGPAFLGSVKDGLGSANWGDIVTLMETLGKDMVSGVATGVLRHADLPAAALANATRAAVAAAQSEIDSHSPSRVTAEEVGRPMVEGIVVGIESSGPMVVRAITRVAADGVAAAKAAVAGVGWKDIWTYEDGSTGPAKPSFQGIQDGYMLGSDGKWYPNEAAMPSGVTGASSTASGNIPSYIGGGQYGALPVNPNVGDTFNGMTWTGSYWSQRGAAPNSPGAQHAFVQTMTPVYITLNDAVIAEAVIKHMQRSM